MALPALSLLWQPGKLPGHQHGRYEALARTCYAMHEAFTHSVTHRSTHPFTQTPIHNAFIHSLVHRSTLLRSFTTFLGTHRPLCTLIHAHTRMHWVPGPIFNWGPGLTQTSPVLWSGKDP